MSLLSNCFRTFAVLLKIVHCCMIDKCEPARFRNQKSNYIKTVQNNGDCPRRPRPGFVLEAPLVPKVPQWEEKSNSCEAATELAAAAWFVTGWRFRFVGGEGEGREELHLDQIWLSIRHLDNILTMSNFEN